MTINLNLGADGFGFHYGYSDRNDGSHVRVDVMPPEAMWEGTIRLDSMNLPDPKQFVVFIDGEEVSRVASSREVADVITAYVEQHKATSGPTR